MKLLITKHILIILILFSSNVLCQNFSWVKGNLGNGISDARSTVKIGSSIYLTGGFNGTIDFDPGAGTLNLSSTGLNDYYLQKLDANGNLIWVKSIGGAGDTYANSIINDNANNIYLSGSFNTQVDFDPNAGLSNLTPMSSQDDGFIQKLDSSGNLIWVKSIGNIGDDKIFSSNIDNNGNLFFSGYFEGTVDFDPGPGINNVTASSLDVFLLKLDTAGNFIWVKTFEDLGTNSHPISIDGNNNIYLSGGFGATIDFDPSPAVNNITSSGGSDGYILKLNNNGDFIWVKSINGSGDAFVGYINHDFYGNLYMTGVYSGTSDFDPSSSNTYNLTAIDSLDNFILKLDVTGNFIWAKTFGGDGDDHIASDVDEEGFIYYTGSYKNTVDFDPSINTYNLTSIGGYHDIFIGKMDPLGNLMWAHSFGSGSDFDYGLHCTINDDKSVYFLGFFTSTVDFDPSPAINNLSSGFFINSFLLKFSQDSCSSLSLQYDSVSNLTCSSSGYAAAHALFGLPPYTYSWNTTPITLDSVASFVSNGIYELTVTDSNNCNKTFSTLINGPVSTTNFDLNANLFTTDFRPGFPAAIFIDAFNDGCDTTSGQLSLVLNQLTSYDSASINPDVISGDTLIWNLIPLIYDSSHFQPVIFVSTDTSTQIGDTLCFDLKITPITGDINPNNNIKNYCFPIVNGYDPNDKQVYPQGECINNYVLKNEVITYTIRFQNTGNSEAINIYVLDSISPNLDINTTRVIGQSHPMYTEVLSGNVLKFNFDSIMLPDSSTNQVGSNGYIIFEILPNTGVLNGSVIENTSEIYFDFNPPVVTNTVMNTLIDIIPSCVVNINEQLPLDDQVNVFPNPTNNYLFVENKYNDTKKIELVDITGKIILKSIEKTNFIDVSNLRSGIYFIKVYTEKDIVIKKIIKQ